MPAPRRRTRTGFARNALTLALAAAGAGLIAFGALAQDSDDPCVGPDGLPILGEPCPEGGSSIIPRSCQCPALYTYMQHGTDVLLL